MAGLSYNRCSSDARPSGGCFGFAAAGAAVGAVFGGGVTPAPGAGVLGAGFAAAVSGGGTAGVVFAGSRGAVAQPANKTNRTDALRACEVIRDSSVAQWAMRLSLIRP